MRTDAFALCLLLALLLVSCRPSSTTDSITGGTTAPVTVSAAPAVTAPVVVLPDGFRVEIEVAADDDSRARGLMFRTQLPSGRGMLFMFAGAHAYSFWMKNTLIPLDMIWIDKQKVIVDVKASVPPCPGDPCPSFGPKAAASYVLELGAGEAAKHGVVAGAKVTLENIDSYQVR